MYITCQQCSTMFRLDESLLKPTGSKVRCSQCGNVFVEYPPKLEADKPADEPVFADEPVLDNGPVLDDAPALDDEPLLDDAPALDDEPLLDDELALDDEPALGDESAIDDIAAIEAALDAPSEASFDQELEGIDLDELDAIFDQGDLDTAAEEKDADVQTAAPENDTVDELDTQDLEMNFDLDLDTSDTGQADQSEEVATALAEDEFDTLDLDLDFDLDTEAPGEDQPTADLTEGGDDLTDDLDLDLENLDFSLDEITEEDDADTAGGEDDLDLALATDEGADELSGKADEDFDLSELDELLDEGEKAEDEAPELALEAQEPAPVAEDEELLLDMDEPTGAALEGAGEEADDFDLAELDDMLGSGDDSGRVSSGVERDVVDEGAELALDDAAGDETVVEPMTELEAATVEEPSEPSEELDLSDLDAMLDDVDGPTDKGAEADEDVEDLDFELDADFSDKPVSEEQPEVAEAQDTQDEELDLSDIEQMLEGDDALDTQQLEADFLGLNGDKDEAPELELDDTDEIDLDEIEAAIDEADSEPVADAVMMAEDEDQELSLDDADSIGDGTALDLSLDEPSSDDETELELSLDDLSSDDDAELELDDDLVLELDSDDDDTGTPQVQEAEEELDLSDLDLGADQESTVEADRINAGDMELEFHVEEDEPEQDVIEKPAAAAQKQEESQEFSISETVPTPQTDEFEFETAVDEPPAKKSTSKGLVVLFLVLLLGGAGYLYYAVTYQGLNIPVVSQLLKPEPKDPAGILKLTTMDINSKFVDTEKSGRIFVIEGKVRNGYADERQMIRLQGKLFTKGKVLAKSEFSYAGVKIADEALTSLPTADLKKKLNSGIAQGAATKVQAGGTLPFMIVFSELPENLDEFAIEAISSMQSK